MKKLFSSSPSAKTIAATALVLLLLSQSIVADNGPNYDFSGDGCDDFILLRLGQTSPYPWTWKIRRNQGGAPVDTTFNYGVWGDNSMSVADYYGTGKAEVSYVRSGVFYDSTFVDGAPPIGLTITSWGSPGDIPAAGDYDGDGKDDRTLIRNYSGFYYWYIKGSTGVNRVTAFGGIYSGWNTFVFQGADYTGDGKDELVICYIELSTKNAYWYFGDPVTGATVATKFFGNSDHHYLLNPADYSGDGRADLAIAGDKNPSGSQWRWQIYNPGTGVSSEICHMPVPFIAQYPIIGDYDGDGRGDCVLFEYGNPITAPRFVWRKSSTNTNDDEAFGSLGDLPLASLYVY